MVRRQLERLIRIRERGIEFVFAKKVLCADAIVVRLIGYQLDGPIEIRLALLLIGLEDAPQRARLRTLLRRRVFRVANLRQRSPSRVRIA